MRSGNYVILGGDGFLGRHLVKAFADSGHHVVVLDRSPRPDGTAAVDAVTSQRFDILVDDFGEVLKSRPIDGVAHFATAAYVPPSLEDPAADLRANAESTVRLLHAVATHSPETRVFLASSAAVYGTAREIPIDERHPISPESPYGVSKYAAERYAQYFVSCRNLRVAVGRLFSLYGPGQRKQVVYDVIRRAMTTEGPLHVLGLPHVTRDFFAASDAAGAVAKLFLQDQGFDGLAINFCSGRETSLAELAATILELVGSSAPVQFSGELRAGDPERWVGSSARLRSLIEVDDTPLLDGLRETVEWVRGDIVRV